MGWTSYLPMHFTKSGNINRKAECDKTFTYGSDSKRYKVLKSTMKGSVYYAAIQNIACFDGFDDDGKEIYTPIENGKVWCAICLTKVKDGEFYCKDMDETMGPLYYDCPKSILNLLSETDNKYALKWRQKCREKLNKTV